MQIFIDSIVPEEIFKTFDTGIIDGITTNLKTENENAPSAKDFLEQIQQKLRTFCSFSIKSKEVNDIVEEAKVIARMGKHITINLKLKRNTIEATKILRQLGINVNIASVYSANQAIIAAKAGAEYVSIKLNEVERSGQSIAKLLEEITEIFLTYNFKTKFIAYASSQEHVRQSALLGVDCISVPVELFWKMFGE